MLRLVVDMLGLLRVVYPTIFNEKHHNNGK